MIVLLDSDVGQVNVTFKMIFITWPTTKSTCKSILTKTTRRSLYKPMLYIINVQYTGTTLLHVFAMNGC